MRILCTGDSITAAGRDTSDPTDLGQGYVARLAAALPAHELLDTGINGNKVPDLEARWEVDVLAHAPDLLSVKIGINDTWHAHLSGARARLNRLRPGGGGTGHDRFEVGYRNLVAQAQAAGIERLVLVEPFLVPFAPEQERMLPDLAEKARRIRDLAAEHDATFVPLQAAFDAAPDPRSLVTDGVHPTPAGHDLIAQQWLEVAGPLTGG